ncbi:DNA primase, partial [[Kitasatospora] papulosa]
MSSAESSRFDAAAAAQQMLDFEAVAPAWVPPQHVQAPAMTDTPVLLPPMLTDRGNAKLFA